jgi:hypothetical protein
MVFLNIIFITANKQVLAFNTYLIQVLLYLSSISTEIFITKVHRIQFFIILLHHFLFMTALFHILDIMRQLKSAMMAVARINTTITP